MQMRLHQPKLLSLLTISYAALASTSPDIIPSNTHLLNDSQAAASQNQTLALPIQPPSFSITYEIGGPKLRTTACLMNAIDALKILALGDWYANILDGTEYRMASYPEVSISISTQRRRRSIQARYVVWAIMLGVVRMITENRFEFAQFEMRWDGVVVGWVHVVDNPPLPPPGLVVGGGGGNGGVGVAKRTASVNGDGIIDGSNITTTDAANDEAEARLMTIFQPVGTTLGIYDIFLPIMNALSDMAAYPSTHRSEGLVAGFEGMRGNVCILPVRPLEYEWMIRALARIPGYMLGVGRFGEVSVRVLIDGGEVAVGRVSRVPGCF